MHIPCGFMKWSLGQSQVPVTEFKVAFDPTWQLRQLSEFSPKQVAQKAWQVLQLGEIVVKSLYLFIVGLQQTPRSGVQPPTKQPVHFPIPFFEAPIVPHSVQVPGFFGMQYCPDDGHVEATQLPLDNRCNNPQLHPVHTVEVALQVEQDEEQAVLQSSDGAVPDTLKPFSQGTCSMLKSVSVV